MFQARTTTSSLTAARLTRWLTTTTTQYCFHFDRSAACLSRVLILMREICKPWAAASVQRETSANRRHLASQTSSYESSAPSGMLFVFVPNLNIPIKVFAAFNLAFAPLSSDYSQCAKSIILVESTDGIRHYLPCRLAHKLSLCVTMPR